MPRRGKTPTNADPEHFANTSIIGIDLDGRARMETINNPLTSRVGEMLRWQFRMRNRLLTCGIKSGPNGFSVITLPHWDVKGGIVETFHNQASALQRHARIAEQLRSAGWSIASYTP